MKKNISDLPIDELWRIINYLYEDEEENYYENDKPDGHIFNAYDTVNKWLIGVEKEFPTIANSYR